VRGARKRAYGAVFVINAKDKSARDALKAKVQEGMLDSVLAGMTVRDAESAADFKGTLGSVLRRREITRCRRGEIADGIQFERLSKNGASCLASGYDWRVSPRLRVGVHLSCRIKGLTEPRSGAGQPAQGQPSRFRQ
jgi:hypothetical protein